MSSIDPAKAIAIIPRTVDEVNTLAARFAKASLLPADLRGKEADVFVTILAGQELGLPPMAALRGIHVVKGKPILSADTMVGVVLGRGVAKYFQCVEETETHVTYETHREGAPTPVRATWTLADAKRAGLDGDNWRKYPRAMMKARCKAVLARDVYPDVLAGCYEENERDEVAGPAPKAVPFRAPVDVVDAVVVELDEDELDITLIAISEAESLESLKAIGASIAKMPEVAKARLKEPYKARVAALKGAA